MSIAFPRLRRPLIAILRGIKSEETADIASALIDSGFEAIEIPLNSPDPFRSIEIAAKLAPSNCLIGAGTVLTCEQVDQLANAGGRLMVSPNVVPEVIAHATKHNMVTMPGVFTATEALQAVAAGASGLKFFPANILGPIGINAIRAVLPENIEIGAVGGISEKDFADYNQVGIHTFGLGSSLYKPGFTAAQMRANAEAVISAFDDVFDGQD